MSTALVYLFFLYCGIRAEDITILHNDGDVTFESDEMQAMQKHEESARRMWEHTSRKEPIVFDADETEQLEESSEKVELYTWFPWFEMNGPKIHTIKAVATLNNENSSNLAPQLGVGFWHEITLFGKRKEINSNEEPDAKALNSSKTSAIKLSSTFKWISVSVVCLVCLLV